ncbi:hypothetical protein ABPG72_006094 [Tetrahymena utriculariae]
MAEEQKQAEFEKDQKEIRSLIWQNKIPVKIKLDPDQNSNNEEPFPLYMFFQRVHLPVFYYEQIHEYFEKFAPVPRNQDDIWLEWNNKPIAWNLPFGVTFDLNYQDPSMKGELGDEDSFDLGIQEIPPPFIPQNIILHYGPCTISNDYIPIPSIPGKTVLDIAKKSFRFTLKESLHIRFDSDTILMQMEAEKQNELWDSYKNLDQNTFFSILDQIFQLKNHLQNNKAIKLPVRVYIEGYIGRIQLSHQIESENDTLGDFLTKYFPKILKQTDTAFEIINDNYKNFKVICNGIVCNLNMPLLYFYKYFSHYDGFTYLCIQK